MMRFSLLGAVSRATCLVVSLASLAASQTFTERIGSSGFISEEASQGVALGDYDGDGDVDLFLPGLFFPSPLPPIIPDFGARDRLYRNGGTGVFTDVAPSLGCNDDGQAQGAAFADYDNDGLLDLYLVKGLQAALPEGHILYHQAPGVFDSTPSSFVAAAQAGRSVCWADYDNDGFADVFVTNGLDSSILPDARLFLFRNQTDGTFADVTVPVGLADTRNGMGCAWSDFDNDGDMDLYVANKGFEDPVLGISDPQANALYKNQLKETGTATFVDVAIAAGVTGIDTFDPGGAAFGCGWADFDNDGWMDLYVSNGFSGVLPVPTANRLYRNRGDGTFADVTIIQFLTSLSVESSFSFTWGDFDNDGFVDLFVGNANLPVLSATHDLYRNGGWPLYMFSNIAGAAGVELADFGQACASADFNGDGYLDIYATRGVGVLTSSDRLFMNDGGSNHWLHLNLVGVVSNRSAIGARVTLTAGGRSQTREVAAGSGYQSMDDLRVEFGLGGATVADEVEIRWPSGCVQTLTAVAGDRVVEVVESCVIPLDDILRQPVISPIALMFPLPVYVPAPPTPTWDDPVSILDDPGSFFYQHSQPVTILLVKTGRTVQMSW